jgi:hypothetical protein
MYYVEMLKSDKLLKINGLASVYVLVLKVMLVIK